MAHLRGEYCFALNSADLLDPELPLVKAKAHGGTMVMWKHCHDPYIKVCKSSSTSALPFIFSPPGNPPSIHVSIYLPTHGQDSRFVEELSALDVLLQELLELHPESPIFLRGDFNVNAKNTKRAELLHCFSESFDLTEAEIKHTTYHHFTGNGRSDSNLDKLMFSSTLSVSEAVDKIHCKLEDPTIDSHHDLIVSTFHLPAAPIDKPSDDNLVAPKVLNTRSKVKWTDSGIAAYQKIVIPELQRLQDLWYQSTKLGKTSLSLLCESTNNILSSIANTTNKCVNLAQSFPHKSKPTPLHLRKSSNYLLKMHRSLKIAVCQASPHVAELKSEYSFLRAQHRRLVREDKAAEAVARDTSATDILAKDPRSFFKRMKSSKIRKAATIHKLKVNGKTYLGESVPDGFFDSIRSLKTRDNQTLRKSKIFLEYCEDFQNILKICERGTKIPVISEKESFEILMRMKPIVCDYFSITPNHYIYAGPGGWKHFHLLLGLLLANVNDTDIVEVNTAYACILFKGHEKDKECAGSYRTISTCPVIAKALDMYIRDLNIQSWNKNQPDCQFQGSDSSHELASLLVTECVQHSLHHLKQPMYLLLLDAKSAFDVVLRELLVKNLYFSGTSGEMLLYLNNRLENRRTFLDWNGQLMGPIYDEQGLEQGGVSSSDLYKIFNQDQLKTAQASELGVPLGPLTVSSVGQADDTALVSNSIHNLNLLLHLTSIFCSKYQVTLSSDKTKLLAYHKADMKDTVDYWQNANPIKVNGNPISFTCAAEHVGVVRSISGNLPAIQARISAHKKALGAVLHAGIGRNHRANPTASIRIQQIYGNSVLFSGIASLVLNKHECNIVAQHHKETLSNLQRLLQLTPRSVIYFLAGTLPGEAIVHMRQLSIFSMILRLPGNILHSHAMNIFNFVTTSPKSWFHQIRDICVQYDLPHPLHLLKSPPSKEQLKILVKKKVINFWEQKLRHEASTLTSLKFFHPSFMSLSSPHPLWRTAASSPTKVTMATIQARLLSGRYRTESLCSHWSTNSMDLCKMSTSCQVKEDIPHILQHCSALKDTREKLIMFTINYCNSHPIISDIIHTYCNIDCRLFCQFLLDCSVLPDVICAVQSHGQKVLEHLFNITRIWTYSLHRDRLKLLGRWRNFSKK